MRQSLSAVQNADEIICLDEGRLIERGRHDDLLALNGAYARFWREQQKEAKEA